MIINNLLKLVAIIVILMIGVAGIYYYLFFLPKNEQNKIAQQTQQQLTTLTLQFIKECERKYDELEKDWHEKPQEFRTQVLNTQEEGCKKIKNTDFDIERFWKCVDGELYFYSKEEFIEPCVKWKFEQLNSLLNLLK